MIHDVNVKSKEDLLEEFCKRNEHNTLAGEQYTASIIVKSASDVHSAVTEFQKSSEKFSGRVWFLNLILTIATVIGAIATAVLAYKAFM